MHQVVYYKGADAVCLEYSSLWDITVRRLDGTKVKLEDLGQKNKCVLVTNVATNCELAQQSYKEMSEVYEEFKNEGFDIWAFPCN